MGFPGLLMQLSELDLDHSNEKLYIHKQELPLNPLGPGRSFPIQEVVSEQSDCWDGSHFLKMSAQLGFAIESRDTKGDLSRDCRLPPLSPFGSR
jgi:hypothetical protein